jgi:type VI secretion system protein VasJ
MSEFLSKITAPIGGGDPFGSDVNHDADYEGLKAEMGKLGDIDVDAVESLSVKILAEKSKDARALSFLAYAMLRKGDHGRLADVFCALADYCRDSYDGIFPRREGAKLSALRWLSEARFVSACPKVEASARDAEHVERLLGALLRLKAALEKRFSSGGAPFPLLLYKRALEWEGALKEKAEPVSAPAVVSEPAPAYGGGAGKPSIGPVGRPENKKDGMAAGGDGRKEIAKCLKRIAEILES